MPLARFISLSKCSLMFLFRKIKDSNLQQVAVFSKSLKRDPNLQTCCLISIMLNIKLLLSILLS